MKTNNTNFEIDSNISDQLKINTSFTKPDVKYHWVEDEQLESFMELSTPLSWTVAFTCGGYAIGNFRDVLSTLNHIDTNLLTYSDLIFFGLFSAASAISLVTLIYAICSKSKAKKILSKIRSRESISLNG